MDKYCDVYPYTDVHEAIKSVTIIQVDTTYDNPDTREMTVLS